MFPSSPEQWAHFLGALGVKPAIAALWAEPWHEECTADKLSRGEEELDDLMAEALHESGMLTATVENLNYSAPRIRELGALYGPGSRWARAAREADVLAGDPQALAETLYGGRFGNVHAGDGWRFRGRGFPMVTFADNYARLGDLIGQDLVGLPELLEQKRFAVQAFLLWWEDKIPDSMLENPDAIRRRVQGGQLGLAHTRKLAAAARATLPNYV